VSETSQLGTERKSGSDGGARQKAPRRTRQASDQKARAERARVRQSAAAEPPASTPRIEANTQGLDVAVRRRRITRALFVGDVVALSTAYAAALPLGIGSSPSPALEIGTFVLVLVCGTLLSSVYGLYSRDDRLVNHTTADDLVPVLHVMLIVTWMAALAAWLEGRSVNFAALVVFLGVTLAVVPATRAAARGWHRRRPGSEQNTVIVGAGVLGQLLADKLTQRRVHGLRVVGFVDDAPPQRSPAVAAIPVLGGVEELPSLIEAWDVDRVMVAFSLSSVEGTQRLVRSLRGSHVQIDIVPRLFDVAGPSDDIHSIDGVPLIGHPRPRHSAGAERAKRLIDVSLASTGLIVLAPLLGLIGVLVRLDSRGPAIYNAVRLGRGGRSFKQLKFRTMHTYHCHGAGYGGDEAERAFLELLAANEQLREQYERTHKLDPDPRVTRIGRVLRATSLDELPQLWNVVRGDLSLVGPRPVTDQELTRYGEYARDLLSVRPGLTGYWQVSGRSALGYDERVRLDLAYVKSWSLKLDLLILLRTTNLFTGRAGAV
jgi:exopolysaccharide biosynthesis polyprenyl glycosylphosphotransferase